MATTQKIVDAGGTTTSFSNTPQAQDDILNYTEESVVKGSLNTSIILDVMQNDLGGNAKTLFSIDDGISTSTATKQPAPIDLTRADSLTGGMSAWEDVGGGISIRINNGKVEMDLAGYLAIHGLSSLQALGAGVQISDSFTYAIKLANGTLSWATARFNIVGTNDGPIITGSSGLGSVTEDTSPTSAAGTINFSDIDVTDTHTVSATPAAGGYLGTFTPIVTNDSTGDGTGQVSWNFTVDNAALQFLAAGQILTQTYNVTINDGHGGTVSQAVTITIHGTNDGPDIRVNAGDSGSETIAEANSGLSATGTLTVTDVDTLDTVSSAVTGVALSGTAGSLVAADVLSMLSLSTTSALTANTGEAHNLGWTFNSGSQAFNYLAAGEHLTLTYTVTSTDNHSTSDTQTVTVNITGANDAASISVVGSADTEVQEDGGVANGTVGDPSAAGQLKVTDVDTGEDHFATPASLAGSYGAFTFNATTGAWTYTLDQDLADHLTDGEAVTDTLTVSSFDGTDSHNIVVNITGANDAASISVVGSEDTEVQEDGGVANGTVGDPSAAGQLKVTDVDTGEDHFATPASLAGSYGAFTFNATTGAWTYTLDQDLADHLTDGEAVTDTLTVSSFDGTDSHNIVVNITGANDAASISVVGSEDTEVQEDGGVANGTVGDPSAAGQLKVTDVDTGEDHFATPASLAGSYGAFTFNATTGAWTYTLDQDLADHLTDGEAVTDTLTVSSFDGTDSHNIVVNITGANDAASISVVGSEDTEVQEDGGVANGTVGDPSAAGQLKVTDVDTGEDHFATPASLAGSYGAFTFNATTGAWTYTLDQDLADHLTDGEAVTDTLTVSSFDGTDSHNIVVNITGANDAPVAVADIDAGLEDTTITGTVAPNVSDVDVGDALAYALTNVVAGLVLNADGSYSLDASDAAYQHLAAGATTDVVANYTVTDEHGATDDATLTITVTGVNDGPTATINTFAATEGAIQTATSGTPLAAGNVITGGTPDSDPDGDSLTVTSMTAPTVTETDAQLSITSITSQSAGSGEVARYQILTNTGTALLAVTSGGDVRLWTTAGDPFQGLGSSESAAINFNYTVSDGHGGTSSAATTITVNGSNDGPTATINTFAATEGAIQTATSGTPLAAGNVITGGTPDSDPDGDSLTVTSITAPTVTETDAQLSITSITSQSAGSGEVARYQILTNTGTALLAVTSGGDVRLWTTAGDPFQGLGSSESAAINFNYTVSDGHGGTSSAATTITVNGSEDISNTLISTVVDGRQGNNSTPSTVTITFAAAAHANFVNLSDVMHVSGLANVTVINGSGSFIDSTHYQFSVDKGAGSSNGSSYTLDIDAGAFSDNAGNTNAAKHTTNLKPAGVAGEAINLALGDLALSDHNQIHVTVGGVPAGWSLNAGTLNADGTWTLDTADPGALAVTSPDDFTGAIVLDVNATWTNADGTTGSTSISDNIEVFAPGNPIYALSQEDHLTGSSGADLFVFGQPISHDTLHSFDAAADRIDLIGFTGVNGFGDLVIADDANGNAVVTISSGETITVLGVTAAQLGAGNFVFNEEPITQNAGTMSIADGAIMPLGGIVENTGTIALNGAGGATQFEVIVNSLTLKGGGQVTLSDSDGNLIFGGAPEAVLNNVDNTISGAGQIGGGQLTLVNAGTINANGSHALVIDTGSIAVTNSGVIEASGSGGLIILSDVDNSGSIRANGGDLAIHGDVTGSGTATISGTGTLELDGASNLDVEFADSAAQRLILDEGNDFAGTVTGFGDGDSFDFSTIGVGGSATFSYTEDASGLGGLLTASDGIDSISIQLFGDYAAGDFVGLQDQHHGFVVTYHPFAVI